MSRKIKRVLFWALFILFIGYTIAVDTSGTAIDKGEFFLTADAKKGKLLFQKYNCTACHQLYGLGGYMGPDLTNVMSQPGKGSDYVNAFLAHGTNRMPDFSMNSEERKVLIAFLTYTDHTGKSPVNGGAVIQPDGSITLPDEK